MKARIHHWNEAQLSFVSQLDPDFFCLLVLANISVGRLQKHFFDINLLEIHNSCLSRKRRIPSLYWWWWWWFELFQRLEKSYHQFSVGNYLSEGILVVVVFWGSYWVTCLICMSAKVKRPEGSPARSRGPKEPSISSLQIFLSQCIAMHWSLFLLPCGVGQYLCC